MPKTSAKLWSNVECDAWIFSKRYMASLTKAKTKKLEILNQEYNEILKNVQCLEKFIDDPSIPYEKKLRQIDEFEVMTKKLGVAVEKIQQLRNNLRGKKY